MMKIGYARVSTEDQNLDRQIDALRAVGVEKIYQEKISGATIAKRPQLQAMLHFIRENDVVYVLALDRLGRNSKDLSTIIEQIQAAGCVFQSLDLPDFSAIPDTNLRGMLTSIVLTVCKYMAEQERQNIRERQAQGIRLAKLRGVYKGRPVQYSPHSKNARDRHTYFECKRLLIMGWRVAQIKRELGISANTIYRIKAELDALKQTE
jgi:DNA invertase Pin-like site-specific DNA recombinase